jgi:hypothetical protein
MMIGFYDQVFRSLEDVNLDVVGGESIDIPNYTGVQLVTSGRWKIIGNSPELLAAASIPELRVVGSLYYKDTYIRQLSYEELTRYPQYRGQGGLFIENWLREHFTKP